MVRYDIFYCRLENKNNCANLTPHYLQQAFRGNTLMKFSIKRKKHFLFGPRKDENECKEMFELHCRVVLTSSKFQMCLALREGMC